MAKWGDTGRSLRCWRKRSDSASGDCSNSVGVALNFLYISILIFFSFLFLNRDLLNEFT
jgi:hypothetical protein